MTSSRERNPGAWAIEATRQGSAFDSGNAIEAHYDAAREELPRTALILFYLYLLWFRGFVPRPIAHNSFDYYCLVLAVLLIPMLGLGLYHAIAWLRLEAKGMEYSYGSLGPAGGLFRVSHRISADEALLDRFSRDQRKSMEIATVLRRRKDWLLSTLALCVSVVATYIAYAYEPWVGWAAGIAVLGPSTAWWLRSNFDAIAYRLGAQFIPGAKVLDLPVPRPDGSEVADQKAHGEARLATETEVRAAASGTGKRSSVHDQEF